MRGHGHGKWQMRAGYSLFHHVEELRLHRPGMADFPTVSSGAGTAKAPMIAWRARSSRERNRPASSSIDRCGCFQCGSPRATILRPPCQRLLLLPAKQVRDVIEKASQWHNEKWSGKRNVARIIWPVRVLSERVKNG